MRERAEDIEPILGHFLKRLNEDLKMNLTINEGAIKALRAYDFPGNVRELQNLVIRASLMAKDGAINSSVMNSVIADAQRRASANSSREEPDDYRTLKRRIALEYMDRIYEHCGRNLIDAHDFLSDKGYIKDLSTDVSYKARKPAARQRSIPYSSPGNEKPKPTGFPITYKGRTITEEEVVNALKRNNGIMKRACTELDIKYQTFVDKIHNAGCSTKELCSRHGIEIKRKMPAHN